MNLLKIDIKTLSSFMLLWNHKKSSLFQNLLVSADSLLMLSMSFPKLLWFIASLYFLLSLVNTFKQISCTSTLCKNIITIHNKINIQLHFWFYFLCQGIIYWRQTSLIRIIFIYCTFLVFLVLCWCICCMNFLTPFFQLPAKKRSGTVKLLSINSIYSYSIVNSCA